MHKASGAHVYTRCLPLLKLCTYFTSRWQCCSLLYLLFAHETRMCLSSPSQNTICPLNCNCNLQVMFWNCLKICSEFYLFGVFSVHTHSSANSGSVHVLGSKPRLSYPLQEKATFLSFLRLDGVKGGLWGRALFLGLEHKTFWGQKWMCNFYSVHLDKRHTQQVVMYISADILQDTVCVLHHSVTK